MSSSTSRSQSQNSVPGSILAALHFQTGAKVRPKFYPLKFPSFVAAVSLPPVHNRPRACPISNHPPPRPAAGAPWAGTAGVVPPEILSTSPGQALSAAPNRRTAKLPTIRPRRAWC